MRRRARTDANHAAITQTLRSCGWYVIDTSRIGSGFPDLLAAKNGAIVLVEVKDGAKAPSRRRLTMDEIKVCDGLLRAGVRVRIVTSIEDAVWLSA